jgi:TRAP-type C4-dicarboxylate transport system substrate-binding protein
MRKFKGLKTTLCAAAAICLATAVPASAENFRITVATGHATHLPWIKAIKEFYIPEANRRLAANGRHKIVWTEAYGGTLAKVGGVLEAVRSGVAEMGFVYTIFEPANLPLLAVSFIAPFGSDNVVDATDISREMHEKLPELRAQWSKHNQVFLGAVATDTNYLLTKFPVKSIDDVKGRKLGGAGTVSLWLSGVGAVPVQGNFATHFNNIKTGVYDGLIGFTTGMFPAKLHQVAPYATKVNFGSLQMGAISINKALHEKLPAEVRKTLREVGRDYSTKVSRTMLGLAKIFEKKMGQMGTKFSQLPAAERKRWAMTMPNIAKNWVDRNEKRGLAAKKVLSTYLDLLRARGVTPARDWDQN